MRADQVKIVRVPDMHKVDHRFLTSASITKLRDKAAKAIVEYNDTSPELRRLRGFLRRSRRMTG